MSYSLKYINNSIEKDPKAFVDECDRIYHERIVHAADMICDNMPKSHIVLLSGPSGSGKTTTAKKVAEELKGRGVNSRSVSLDDYFKTVDYETTPRTPEGELDFESPLCLDMELLKEHLAKLERGEEIHIPYFMFARGKRSISRFTPMRLEKNEIAIFEGIHAFNDQLTNEFPEAFNLYISAVSDVVSDNRVCFKTEWMRLVRRTVRDNKFRGADALFTMTHWPNVLDGEKKYILPMRHKADLQLDSSLAYEIPLMKPFACPLFKTLLEETGDKYPSLKEILDAFGLFDSIGQELLDPASLLCEFVGGGIYTYD